MCKNKDNENEACEFEPDENNTFSYCNKVDLHVMNPWDDLSKVVALAGEHNFRGIAVPLGRLEKLVDAINKPSFGSKEIKPICILDNPFGESSFQVRNYSILDAKEKGAKEVEIFAPYSLIVDESFNKVYDDLQKLSNTAEKSGIKLKYIIKQNDSYIDNNITRLCRITKSNKVNMISLYPDIFDKNCDHADNIIRMRDIKSKSGALVKVYIKSSDVDEIVSYVKAGVDIIGIPWRNAANTIHNYEEIVQGKKAE